MNKIIANSVILCVIIGCILIALGLLAAKPLLRLLDTPEDIIADAVYFGRKDQPSRRNRPPFTEK